MTPIVAEAVYDEVDYPESDGQPMSDNTIQFQWIIHLAVNLTTMFDDREDVFVSGNQNWYPVQGEPRIVAAPDVYVVFGRPKGHRGSWKQWEENDVPMTVVFEVLSPSNTLEEMIDKFLFYEDYGVEEYYMIDPNTDRFEAHVRRRTTLVPIGQKEGFRSPKLGIQFQRTEHGLTVLFPDGKPFLTHTEQANLARIAREQAKSAEQRADVAEQRADVAEQRAEVAEQSKAVAEQRANRLSELTRKLLAQQATPEEIAELQRLTNPL